MSNIVAKAEKVAFSQYIEGNTRGSKAWVGLTFNLYIEHISDNNYKLYLYPLEEINEPMNPTYLQSPNTEWIQYPYQEGQFKGNDMIFKIGNNQILKLKTKNFAYQKYRNGSHLHFIDIKPMVGYFRFDGDITNANMDISFKIDAGYFSNADSATTKCKLKPTSSQMQNTDIAYLTNAHFLADEISYSTHSILCKNCVDCNFDLKVSHLIDDIYNITFTTTKHPINTNSDTQHDFDNTFFTIGKYSYCVPCYYFAQYSSERSANYLFTSPISFYFQCDNLNDIVDNNFKIYLASARRNDSSDSRIVTQSFKLNSYNRNPTISDYNHYLGEKNSAFSIDYTVWDDDGDKLSVTQKLNTSVLGYYSNVSSGTSSTIYITDDMLKKLPLNQKQYIYIYVTDGKGGTAIRTLSFTRTNSAPTISGYDMDMGDKNVGFSINYTVSDADNDIMAINEMLNGKGLRNITDIKGSASETLTISNQELYNTPLNQKSTIIITVADNKGGMTQRTYTFTRTNTPVAIGIIKKTYPTITFRCTDSNPSGYVRLVEIFINHIRVQSFTSGFDGELSYNIDFSYLNEGNNTLMIRATNNQDITSNKILNVHKKSLKEPDVGTNIIVKGKKYQIINKKSDGINLNLVLNKPLQNDVSKTDRIEILNDYCKVFAKTDENNTYQQMDFIISRDLGNGYAQERYQLDITGRNVETRVLMYGNTAIKQVKEAFQYLED